MLALDSIQPALSPVNTLDTALLSIWVAGRHYLAHRDQVDAVGLIDPSTPPLDRFGKPQICFELALLFAAELPEQSGRRHALSIMLRRRGVALLADRVDLQNIIVPLVLPLPPILLRRLARPWFLGVVIVSGEPLLVLDLRCIATDVVMPRPYG